MLTNIAPYLYFDGNCEEAIGFYIAALGGEINQIMKVSDGPKEYHAPEHMNKIMHAVITLGNAQVLASDSMGQDCSNGTNTFLSMNFESPEEIRDAWNKLKEGAQISMDLQDTFWGAIFGTLTDKYGINWMFNHDKKQ